MNIRAKVGHAEANMGVELRWITGMMVGLEFIQTQGKNVLIVDLVVVRCLVFLT